METLIKELKDTPIPTILVVGGMAFLLLAIAGQLAGRIVVAPERQRWAALIGGGLLAIGLALHIVPLLQSRGTPPTPERPSPPQPSRPSAEKPPPKLPVSPPLSITGPVESYRVRTEYLPATNVEFSVYVNDVYVGAYSAGGVTADITRFIKPGENKVRISWTADPSGSYAAIFIEVKQGEAWNPLITREVYRHMKPGETTSTVIDHGTAS